LPFVLALVSLLSAAACSESGSDRPDGRLKFDEQGIRATVEDGVATVRVRLASTTGSVVEGSVRATLRHVDGTVLDRSERGFAVNAADDVVIPLAGLPQDATEAGLAAYVLDYQVRTDHGRSIGVRSLFEALQKIELQVLTSDRYPVGQSGFVRLFARDPSSGAPIADAQVVVELETPEGARAVVATGRTDEFGALGARLALPETVRGDAKLIVAVDGEDAAEEASADVAVLPDARILLTTDKPLYQPGQTIHLRALALERGTRLPYAGGEIVFQVEDAKGNKVFKELQVADEYGIAATTFRLATQVNMGQFRLKASLGDASEIEKQVTVERYALPKFKVEVGLDRTYYLPGETVRGTVSAQYFFGQSVAGGTVTISAKTFDVGFSEFAVLSGMTSPEGLYAFELRMPDYVVGQPLAQGNGLVAIEVTVRDGADHEQTTSRTTVVARAEVEVTLVPESGELIPGVANDVHVVLSDPTGGPLTGTVDLTAQGATDTVLVDDQGLGRWEVTPETVPLDVRAVVTREGATPVTQDLQLAGGGVGRTILLRTDRALYQAGDPIQVTVLLPQERARVFLDVVHGGRTVTTEAVTAEDGRASWELVADHTLEGALQLHAYFLGAQSEIVRDERLVYVESASELRVRLQPDRDVYAPGDPAAVDVEVTDAEGTPRAAALGVQVVDEAVFALQESQPGLLKVYFALEEALAAPKFQFAWPDLSPDSVIEPPGDEPGGTVAGARQDRAAVAFAAQAGGAPAYGVNVNTHKTRLVALASVLKPLVREDVNRLVDELRARVDDAKVDEWSCDYENPGRHVEALGQRLDFWGQPYRIGKTGAEWDEAWDVTTGGPDEALDTADDVTITFHAWDFSCGKTGGWPNEGGWADGDFGGGGAVPGARDDEQNAGPPMEDPGAGDGEAGASGPRVRRFFPETLFVDPSVITDGSGRARIELTMADSITSWRMTALANAADGALGSSVTGLTVFQDFFVDIDFPATLTRGDVVSVPVAVYNYLDIPQTVTLQARSADWLEFVNGASVTIPLDPGQVDAVHFDVRVTKVGPHALTVVAHGSAMSDAVQRTVLVEPDGKKFTETLSARFHTSAPAGEVVTESVRKTVTIPAENIDGAQTLLVKVYPGFFAQAVEGLDSMLQLPGGCLEQTTSTAWPNVLVTAYMRETETLTPEIEMKAQQFLNLGYQRILTFECASGGFNWWEGDDPGNAVLSALVAMQITDASAVTFVDEAVIRRTQSWLVERQQSNGSWTEERHLHAGNENLGASSLRATAYIVWGLAHSGYDGSALDRAANWMTSQLASEDDLYTLALVANALAVSGRGGSHLDRLLRRLHDAAIPGDDGTVHWEASGDTMVGSWDDVAAIETTALAGLALLHGSAYPADVEGAISWLIGHKDPQGNWGYSTQATVLTLKLLLESLRGDAGDTDADVTVLLRDAGGPWTEIETRHFDAFNKDVLWQVDLSGLAIEGDNEVELRYAGVGNLMWQLVSSYHVPWEIVGEPAEGPVSIDVAYDRTQLAVNDTVTVTVTVTLHDAAQSGMILVDLGRPPGFTLHTEDLANLRSEGTIAEYETTDRQILIYLDPLTPEVPKVFTYRLTADYPIEATVPGSTAAPYYNGEDASETPEFGIEVR
jgi:hypothetical protein